MDIMDIVEDVYGCVRNYEEYRQYCQDSVKKFKAKKKIITNTFPNRDGEMFVLVAIKVDRTVRLGWAKCCGTDEFDKNVGIFKAVQKAVGVRSKHQKLLYDPRLRPVLNREFTMIKKAKKKFEVKNVYTFDGGIA